VIKSKSIFVVIMMVLVLALILPACAPAKPVTPPATTPPAAKPVTPPATTPPAATPAAPPATTPPPAAQAKAITTSFEAETYTNTNPDLTVMYPKGWVIQKPDLKGVVFYAKSPDDSVYVVIRPATKLSDAANTFLAEVIAARGLNLVPEVDTETQITMADGKTQGTQILLTAAMGMAKAYVNGVIKDGNAIMVVTGSRAGQLKLYKEIGETLSIK